MERINEVVILKGKYLDWLKHLIIINRLDKFYHKTEWKRLRLEVLKELHYECQDCLAQGKLTLLTNESQVHHIKEVKYHPELALSKYYVDENGIIQRNLICLCDTCHNIRHNRFTSKKSNGFVNEERW